MCRTILFGIVVVGIMVSRGLAQCPGRWEQPTPQDLFSNYVFGLSATPDNRLLVGGWMTENFVCHISVLDDSGWSLLGTPIGGHHGTAVDAFLCMPNGDIIVGGAFSSIDGVSALNIARWDGKHWSPLGSGLPYDQIDPNSYAGVYTLMLLPGGDILAGGLFDIPGVGTNRTIARWNGQSWVSAGQNVPGGSSRQYASNFIASPTGELFVGGTFPQRVRHFDGSGWAPIGEMTGLASDVPWYGSSLAFLPSGDLVVGGISTLNGVEVNGIARWDGTSWHPLGTGFDTSFVFVAAIKTLPNGHLLATGSFSTAGGVDVFRIAEWDGDAWSPLGLGIQDGVASDIVVMPSGDVYVSGQFSLVGGLTVPGLARWTTRPACLADYNCDAMITTDDLFAFLQLFFDYQLEADANRDGTVNSQDFFDFLAVFFAGCPS